MGGTITKGDIELLKNIAEYKLMTVKQLEAITKRAIQVIRRRLRFLGTIHLVERDERGLRKGPGRRENVVYLTKKGIDYLKKENIVDVNSVQLVKEDDFLFLDHNLLVNWFFIHLVQIEGDNPHFATSHRITDKCRMEKGGLDSIPDGVFSITDKTSGKSLLFFLEVDMDTEALVSSNRNSGDIRQKIINYQGFFQSEGYKHYEKIFNATFNGFRLLFITVARKRFISICKFVLEMPPSNFIWLTDQKQMFQNGLSANIWARGGYHQKDPESILGKGLAFVSPVMESYVKN